MVSPNRAEDGPSCDGVTALVTGASRGLGRQAALALADAGASVVLAARSRQDLDRVEQDVKARLKSGARVLTCAVDLASSDAPAVLARAAQAAGLELDVLVNNAAAQGPIGPFWENDWRQWEDSFHINAFAPLRLCRQFLPAMISRGWGKLIFLSGGGATGPRPRFTAYGGAKTVLVRFAETLAAELAGTGVDANAVAPGAMKSAMTESILAAGPGAAGEKEYASAQKLQAGTEEVTARAAALCVFLASHASDGITGKLISAAWDPWQGLADHREELARTDVYTLRRIVPQDRGMDWKAPAGGSRPAGGST